MLSSSPETRSTALIERLAGLRSVAVAFSGGVDSAVVAAAARRGLGDRSLAVTFRSSAVAREEVETARRVAANIGIRHTVIELDPLSDERYVANPTDRCYFCRSLEGSALRAVANREGLSIVVDGIHRDDLGDDRPGIRAMEENGVRHPLLEAGLGKSAVREIARLWDLPNQDAPSNSCLASRVAHGEPISAQLLARVEAAEGLLRSHGFTRVRVRTSGGAARIEVGPDEVPRLLLPSVLLVLSAKLLSLGFSSVSVDPDGYRPAGGRSWTEGPASASSSARAAR